MRSRICSIFVLVSFLGTTLGPMPCANAAGNELNLPVPGTMVNLSPAYMPVMIKGMKIHPENPLLFDFILDTGNSGLNVGNGHDRSLQDESMKLIKYFLAALTIKENDLWVNLSPYEKNRMIPNELGKTELGRDMLAQDYILKQLTASLIYPEKELGKKFWDSVYSKSQQMFGTSQVPVNTFNKVWIVADKAKVFERNNAAFVVGAHLKVMLDEDYLASSKNNNNVETGFKPVSTNNVSSQIIRQIIVPEIEQEVNEGKSFAPLRQMFYSMILASWYKLALKDALLNQVYSNKAKTSGVLSDDPAVKEKIYERYLQAYKKGVFNYIKEDRDELSKKPMPRKYFSGGLLMLPGRVMQKATDPAQMNSAELAGLSSKDMAEVMVKVAGIRPDAAMGGVEETFNVIAYIDNSLHFTYLEKIFATPFTQQSPKYRYVAREVIKDDGEKEYQLRVLAESPTFKGIYNFSLGVLIKSNDVFVIKYILEQLESDTQVSWVINAGNIANPVLQEYLVKKVSEIEIPKFDKAMLNLTDTAKIMRIVKGLGKYNLDGKSQAQVILFLTGKKSFEETSLALSQPDDSPFFRWGNVKIVLGAAWLEAMDTIPDSNARIVMQDYLSDSIFRLTVMRYHLDPTLTQEQTDEMFALAVRKINSPIVIERVLLPKLWDIDRDVERSILFSVKTGERVTPQAMAEKSKAKFRGFYYHDPQTFVSFTSTDTIRFPEGKIIQIIISSSKELNRITDALEQWGDNASVATVDDKTLAPTGGIELNGRSMGLDVAKDGKGVDIKYDAAMIAAFERGNFTGVRPIITGIRMIPSALPILGLSPRKEEENMLAKIDA